MGLSSNVIWHQTTYKGLEAILKDMAFKPSYSLETIKFRDNEINIAFPMISFCDIPFADMYEYLKDNEKDKFTGRYGGYTLGLKRQWGVKKGLSPVWYRDNKAKSLHLQMDTFKSFEKNKDIFALNTEEQFIWYVLAHTKNVQGKLIKHNFESYRFADEREWRYIPTFNELKDASIRPYICANDYKILKKEVKNILIDNFSLSFTAKDISYVLASSSPIISKLKGLCGRKNKNIVFMSYDHIIHDVIGISHNVRP